MVNNLLLHYNTDKIYYTQLDLDKTQFLSIDKNLKYNNFIAEK